MALSATGGTITYAGGKTIHTFTSSGDFVVSGPSQKEVYTTDLYSDANLQGYWRLEADGTDSSGNGNTLTASGSPTHATGKFGNGVDLEASSSQYYAIADGSQTGLDVTGDFTISTWIKRESIGSFQAIVTKDDISDRQIEFYLDSNNKVVIAYEDTVAGRTTLTTTNALTTTGVWFHVVARVDISTGVPEVFVDGTKWTGVTSGGGTTAIVSGAADFMIGARDNAGGIDLFFDGMIDDVAIWDRALTDEEVVSLYGVRAAVLVIGGGGSGGNGGGGGGGAGGYQYNDSYALTAQTYTVTVGTGGAAQTSSNTKGNNGNNSVFGTITANGGGGGGAYNNQAGNNGGSGGGGGGAESTGGAGGTGSQGSNGGTGGVGAPNYKGGGGGGATSAGTSGATVGTGGNGTANSITGTSVTYAGGGGGSANTAAAGGEGGTGGGGAGGNAPSNAANPGVAGTDGLGGGGGGGVGTSSGKGGSGVVIISYDTPASTTGAAFLLNFI